MIDFRKNIKSNYPINLQGFKNLAGIIKSISSFIILNFSFFNFQSSIANSNNDSLTLINYQQAYEHLNNMQSEKETLSFEDAIFTIENAYYNNQLSKTEFTNTINFHTNRILQLANANKQTLSQNMPKAINPLTPSPSEMEGERLLLNWAIYTYMTDTTYWKENVSLSPSTSLRTSLVEAYKTNYPMTYQQGDPYGSSNWEITTVSNLILPGDVSSTNNPDEKSGSSLTKTGNCFSLAVLYKIFSDRLQSEAYLTTAPQHIYIQHKGLDGNFYNVELTTHTFPGSGTIKTYTYTTHDAVTNGIALRRLNEKQEIALCLVYLAKGLEKKLRVKNLSSQRHDEELRMGEFALACAETALKYDPLNLNAMLLKAEALESQIQFLAESQKTEVTSVFGLRSSDLQSYENAVINTVHNVEEKYTQSLEATLFNLYDLGYRQMPTDMQQTLLMMSQGTTPFSQGRRVGDEGLFAGEGVGGWAYDTSLQYLTLSENIFPELESPENIIAIGNTSINIQSQKIESINTNENLAAVDPITFALTIDPLATKYPSLSPYNAMGNNPIIFVDPDGREVVFAPGTSQDFKNKFALAVQKLNEAGLSTSLAQLHESSEVIYVKEGTGTDDAFYGAGQIGIPFRPTIDGAKDVNIVVWNPNNGLAVEDNNSTLTGEHQSPVLGLFHELEHAAQYLKNSWQYEIDQKTPDPLYHNLEEKRVGALEDMAADKLGEPSRTNHHGEPHKTTTPTSTNSGNPSPEEKLHERAAWAKFQGGERAKNNGLGTKEEGDLSSVWQEPGSEKK